MKLLVTGALGHIGSRLIRSASDKGIEEIIIIDNLSTQRYCSLFDLPRGVKYNFIEDDIRSPGINEHFKGVDVVIHLAAITDAASSHDKRDEVFSVNLEGTKNVAEACARNGCKLIFPSTTSVYGTQEEIVDEECPEETLKPQSPYAESKIKAEKLLCGLGESSGLDFLIFRLGTIFGVSPGMRFHTAVNKFCWQASVGQNITVWRTAMGQKRPYLDIADAIDAFYFVIKNNIFDRRIYNAVTLNASVREITGAIAEHIPSLKIELVDCAIMNQLSYNVSNKRFTGKGFNFRGDIKKGIAETLRLLSAVACK